MTASQIQTIGNALAADLVAWGTAAIGLALVAAGAVFWTRCDVPGRMIMRAEPGTGIHEDERLEDFAGMDNRQVKRAGGHHIDSDELVLGVQATDEELFPVQTGKQRLEDGDRTLRRMDRFRRRKGTALADQRDTVPRDSVFPNRAQWPFTVRGTERAINGHVRLLLKLCSSPTLHQPRVGRNEGGGTGLSQRAGLEGRRPARRGPGRPAPLLPGPESYPLGAHSSTQAGGYAGASVNGGKGVS